MKRILALLMAFVLLLGCPPVLAESDAEILNYTRYTDYAPQAAEPVGLIPGSNPRVLVVWFSRVGNTVFDPDVDVVTTATLQRDDSGELVGNAEMIAGWIAEETGGDRFPIQTAYTYPSDYDQTVAVGEGQDIDHLDIKLASRLEDVSGYDIVWLVSPIWHYTICTPLRVFLQETDLSGKTVYVVTTHRGSGFADVPEQAAQLLPDARVIKAMAIPGNTAAEYKDEVFQYVKEALQP